MEASATMSQKSDDLEVAALLLDEWKWRHQHCWKSLQRYSLAALTVALIPYVWLLREPANLPSGSTDLFKARFGNLILVFPFAALILAQAAVWLFASEYVRCRPVEAMYNTVLGSYSPNVPGKTLPLTWKQGVAQLSIVIVGVFSALLTFIDICILVVVANLTVNSAFVVWIFWIGCIAIIGAVIFADCWLAIWSKGEVARRINDQSKAAHKTANAA